MKRTKRVKYVEKLLPLEEVPHPLKGADREGRLRYQIEMLTLDIENARQSGVTGQNLNRWVSKLKVKRFEREQKLEQLLAERQTV